MCGVRDFYKLLRNMKAEANKNSNALCIILITKKKRKNIMYLTFIVIRYICI